MGIKLSLWVSLIVCIILNTQNLSAISRAKKDSLTEKYAAQRSKILSKIHYDLFLSLDSKKKTYNGVVQSNFVSNKTGAKISMDFSGGKIQRLIINNKIVSKINYNGYFVQLNSNYIKKGFNKVQINFTHPYSNTGSGLYRFHDLEDGNTYIYSDLEPYDANRIFPCFDQPDLKATYQVNIEAPKEWEIVSSTPSIETSNNTKNRKLVKFKKSKPYSTYLIPIHAGNYHVWESKYKNIPLKLYARKSFAKYVNEKEWFKISQQGFSFFEDYFDFPYPFEKYDQLIVPDFNAGAMENVGAVTFAERLVQRGSSTLPERERRANVILHEMAHMWFGNLVTMKWWDDLWLNESFATYMASKALYEGTEFKTAWKSFFTNMKQWAYWEDQLVTTHPIEGIVKNTGQAFANFDGITYGKGASVLKQLNYYLGDKNFKSGVRKYFKKHQYTNTKLKDFITSLASASNKDLNEWTKKWLQTSSVNTIEAKYKCQKGKISSFELLQNYDKKFPYLRSRKSEISLFDFNGQKIDSVKVVPVSINDKLTTVKSLVGEKCPILVYPNYNDYDYVKVKLDPKTLTASKNYISQIKKPLDRMMFWQALWDMVRDGNLPLNEYAKLVLDNLNKERDFNIASKVAKNLYGNRYQSPSVLSYLPRTKSSQKMSDRLTAQIEAFFWERLNGSKPNTDFQKLWLDSYVKSSYSKVASNNLKQIINKQQTNSKTKITLDQDRRWKIIQRLSILKDDKVQYLKKKELVRDPSDKGRKMAMAVEVLWPSEKTKRMWFNNIIRKDDKFSLAQKKVVMRNLFPHEQDSYKKLFSKRYFSYLKKYASNAKPEFLDRFTDYLVPSTCETSSVNTLGRFISANPNLPTVALKNLKIAKQEDERCIKIRALLLANWKKNKQSVTP